MDAQDPDRLSNQVLRLLRWHGTILLPALLLDVVLLVATDKLWLAHGHSRNGGPGLSYAAGLIMCAVVSTAAYFLAPNLPMNGSWRMRTPTEGEKGCAVFLIRAFAVFALWGVTIAMFAFVRSHRG